MANPRGEVHSADVAVLGGGLMGSVVARSLAARGADVVVADAGSQMSAAAGTHLRNLPACRGDRSFYADLLAANLRPAVLPGAGVLSGMPAARVAKVAGGMGALWNCVAPRLDPQLEEWPGIAPEQWDAAYASAERLLAVGYEASAGSRRQEALLARLRDRLGGDPPAAPGPAPVAATRDGRTGALRWTGPGEILHAAEPPSTGSITVLPEHAVVHLSHRGGRIRVAGAVALASREPVRLTADAFVVATGPLHTPALLWASDVMRETSDDSPLGRGLHEHPLAHTRIRLPPDLVPGLTDTPARLAADPDPIVLVPLTHERPFHGLVIADAADDSALEGRVDPLLLVSLYWYAQGTPDDANRLTFDEAATDDFGLPRPGFAYALSRDDRELRQRLLQDLREVAACLGEPLGTRPPQLLSAGASMHIMGTTRIGLVEDGRSVADPHGRVWGFSNLYVCGTGLISWPTATNPTLAACALAIRTADRIASGSTESDCGPT